MEENNLIHSTPLSESCDGNLMPIETLIHVIRGRQVMLDSDLAQLYGVETKRLKEQVRRNINRFPEDFMFELTKEDCLRSQIATLNSGRGQHIKYMPFVFTENGIAMLSSVLKSATAIEVNIRIMRAFTAMRSFMMNNAHMFQRLETIEHNYLLVNRHLSEHDRKFEEILSRLDTKESEPIEGFFFEGQIFDAYTLMCDLIRSAKSRIILKVFLLSLITKKIFYLSIHLLTTHYQQAVKVLIELSKSVLREFSIKHRYAIVDYLKI